MNNIHCHWPIVIKEHYKEFRRHIQTESPVVTHIVTYTQVDVDVQLEILRDTLIAYKSYTREYHIWQRANLHQRSANKFYPVKAGLRSSMRGRGLVLACGGVA
jgi:hypothetical protein